MTAQDREVDGVEDVLALFARQPDPAPGEEPATEPRHDQDQHQGQHQGHNRPHDRHRAATPPKAGAADAGRHRASPWAEARAIAARSGRPAATAPGQAATTPSRTRRVPLEQALGHVLAEPLAALTDLPSFDTSAMDGWAVSGPGPWSVRPVQPTQNTRNTPNAQDTQ
ncbi:hypothetical protein P3L51_34835, partial [Streptomyces sp. PSRA5]